MVSVSDVIKQRLAEVSRCQLSVNIRKVHTPRQEEALLNALNRAIANAVKAGVSPTQIWTARTDI